MGRVKYTARRKKKSTNPPSNQPAADIEGPSNDPQPINTSPPEIQPHARPHDDLRPEVDWSMVSTRAHSKDGDKGRCPGQHDENQEEHQGDVMPSGEAFDLYSNINVEAPARRKRGSRRHPGESSSDPSKKRTQTEDPSAPPPSKDMTPPPAPLDPTPAAPLDPTPPAPHNPSPPD
ncbi:early nodulin-like protein 1 [Humulus lupulus]|uniref:early nodulin-like protein 1 n=1 Tax=Humulus lupulus TaxID=3486 RepID=UPI002B4079F7|nr:early nodulin-like protein 1 [Humulus lupulus]